MYPSNHMLGSLRNGVNHVSMNMGDFDRANGPVRGSNYPVYSDALLNWYQSRNVQCVRLSFTWEAVQSALGGSIPSAGANYANYWSDLTGLVSRFLVRNIYVILSMWQFNTASADTDIVYDDAPFTASNFADFWGKFALAMNVATGNDPRVGFDLINEPHTHAESGNRAGDIGISLGDWFACGQAAINAIRAAGATNTIFVPGMAYTAASSFTTNGSSSQWLMLTDVQKNLAVDVHLYSGLGSASPTVLRDSCSALVTWARTNGIKVSIGEIAIDAGSNGRPTYCSTFPIAQTQWADWIDFCLSNDDVLVGWLWWGNSASGWWNQGDSCDPEGYHWGLTLDDGATQTIYMNLIESTLPVPSLYIRDDGADTGGEPNVTTTVAWESPDVWVRQSADGMAVDEPVLGGAPCAVYVSITNKGKAAYPANGNDVVKVLWAKAQSGLSWPAPWNGAVPSMGGMIAPPVPIGSILPGQSKKILVNWPSTPNPADYGNDGHFCLLAFIMKPGAPDFAGFNGPDLNQNVLNWSTVAWHNIHIVPVGKKELGDVVLANYTNRVMRAQVRFEILDARRRALESPAATLFITPRDGGIERLRNNQTRRPLFDQAGAEAFRVLDPGAGIPGVDLDPSEVLRLRLSCATRDEQASYAVRATQYSIEGARPKIVGGQTFVAGHVEGFTLPAKHRRKPIWPWLVISGATLAIAILMFRTRDNDRRE